MADRSRKRERSRSAVGQNKSGPCCTRGRAVHARPGVDRCTWRKRNRPRGVDERSPSRVCRRVAGDALHRFGATAPEPHVAAGGSPGSRMPMLRRTPPTRESFWRGATSGTSFGQAGDSLCLNSTPSGRPGSESARCLDQRHYLVGVHEPAERGIHYGQEGSLNHSWRHGLSSQYQALVAHTSSATMHSKPLSPLPTSWRRCTCGSPSRR